MFGPLCNYIPFSLYFYICDWYRSTATIQMGTIQKIGYEKAQNNSCESAKVRRRATNDAVCARLTTSSLSVDSTEGSPAQESLRFTTQVGFVPLKTTRQQPC